MLVLDRLEFVPGVAISGRIARFGARRQSGRVRVSGRGVAAGRLPAERQRTARDPGRPAGARDALRAHGAAAGARLGWTPARLR